MLFYLIVIVFIYHAQVCTNLESENTELPTFFRKEHSLVRPYQGRGMQVANWDYMGDTLITNEFVRLTPDRQGRRGKCFYFYNLYEIFAFSIRFSL